MNAVYWIFFALYVYAILNTIPVLLLENRNPIKSMSWVVTLIFFPIGGWILYLYFGKNYRREKLISKKSIKQLRLPVYQLNYNHIDKTLLTPFNTGLIRLLYQNSSATAFEHNQISIFNHGTESFEALFAAIEQAKHHIHVEFYIVEPDEMGNRLFALLQKKAREGVEVRFMFDDVGSWRLKKKHLQPLVDAGVQFHSFLPVRLPFLSQQVNYRNHRKIVIIDGVVGFTGGMNIADRYLRGNRLGEWRDTLIRIDGLAVQGLQKVFLIDWSFMNRIPVTGEVYFEQKNLPETASNTLVQIVTSGPDSDWESIMQGFLYAIASARQYVYIQTPYFLPTDAMLSVIKTTALSGVDVRLLMPAVNDSPMTHAASCSYMREIMDAGVKVYFYENSFIHSKNIMIDDEFTSIGSTNMDMRSFEQNFEVNAFIYCRETTEKMKSEFLELLKDTPKLTPEKWAKRPRKQRVKESFSRLFSPLL
jgi:cardiolipin synthase